MSLCRPFLWLAALAATTVAASAQFVVHEDISLFGVDDVEITPDGRLAVMREQTFEGTLRVYDLATGSLTASHPASFLGVLSGPCQDAIAVTNTRAVMIGASLLIADLSQPGAPLLNDVFIGTEARDVAITPDGAFVAVRGGINSGPGGGRNYIFDLQTGAELASHPGGTAQYVGSNPFDVDSVVVNDTHAVFNSLVNAPVPGGPKTRITCFELRPAGGGPPAVVFETTAATDLEGVPHDIALAPDGSFVAVRSEFEVGLVTLTGTPSLAWSRPLFNMPGPLGHSVMDSIEVTNTRIATLSRWSNGGFGAQIDLFDVAGNQYYQILFGDPHDLAITPSGERLVARTHTQVLLYDLVNLPPAPGQLNVLDFVQLPSTHTSYGAGLDSIVATDERAVACARNSETCDVRVYDIEDDLLVTKLAFTMPARPIDVDLSPDGTLAWISGFTHTTGIDLRTDQVVFDRDPAPGGGYPWCDGVAIDDDHVVAFGYTFNGPPGSLLPANSGWISIIDLFRQPSAFCPVTPNSTGMPGSLHATGSASASSNDLDLFATDIPPRAFGFFVYGDTQQQIPAGNGFMCVGASAGTSLGQFPVRLVGAAGVASVSIDNANLPANGGMLLPGTTWHFQFVHRDASPPGAGWNLTNALSIDFES